MQDINLGFNHYQRHVDVTRANFESHYRRSKPSAIVIIDDLAWATYLKKDVIPGTHIIHRHTYGANVGGAANDDSIHTFITPQEWVNDRVAEGYVENNIVAYMGNELATNDRVLNWLIEAEQLAYMVGLKVCVGNWSVGNPQKESDFYLDGIETLLRNLIAHGNFLGLHEYCDWNIYSGLVPKDTYIDLDTAPVYHMGRYFNWLRRARELGLDYEKLQIMITEYGYDRVEDKEAGGLHVARTRWSGPPQEVLIEHWEIVREFIYWHKCIVGVCFYCVADGRERWAEYDLSRLGALAFFTILGELERIATTVTTPTPPPPQEDVFEKYKHTLTAGLRLRPIPGINNDPIVTIPVDTEFLLRVNKPPTGASNYNWQRAKYRSYTGYVAISGGTLPEDFLEKVSVQEDTRLRDAISLIEEGLSLLRSLHLNL